MFENGVRGILFFVVYDSKKMEEVGRVLQLVLI